MTTKYKPGSRVQKVWEVYEKDGADKAFKFGLTLALKETTLRAWVRMWSNGKVRIEATGKSAEEKKQGTIVGRHRICASYDRERLGVILKRGEEVSEVRWDDYDGISSIFVPNKYLLDVKGGK
jgi:hypothetical protein